VILDICEIAIRHTYLPRLIRQQPASLRLTLAIYGIA